MAHPGHPLHVTLLKDRLRPRVAIADVAVTIRTGVPGARTDVVRGDPAQARAEAEYVAANTGAWRVGTGF